MSATGGFSGSRAPACRPSPGVVGPVHLIGDAGFAVLEVAAIAVCPSPLIETFPKLPRDVSAGSPSEVQAMHLKSLSEEAYQPAV
jgi:hypothetical protein